MVWDTLDWFWWLLCHNNTNFMLYPLLLESASEDSAWNGAFLTCGPQETSPNAIILSKKSPYMVSRASVWVDRSMAPWWCAQQAVLRSKEVTRADDAKEQNTFPGGWCVPWAMYQRHFHPRKGAKSGNSHTAFSTYYRYQGCDAVQ